MAGEQVGEIELSEAVFGIAPNQAVVHDVVKVDPELNLIAVRGAVPGHKGSLVLIKSTVKTHRVKDVDTGISKNPQKASGRNPQKASARNR
jgi:large subunit ribosomal protein L3